MPKSLEEMIQKLICEASGSMASQIAAAVRKALAQEIMERLPAGSTQALAATLASKAAGTATPARLPLAPPPPGRTRRTFERRLITPGELASVIDVIRRNPGLTSTQIQKELGIDGKEAARLLGKLRLTNKVAWKGERAKATYTVA